MSDPSALSTASLEEREGSDSRERTVHVQVACEQSWRPAPRGGVTWSPAPEEVTPLDLHIYGWRLPLA